MPSTKKPKRRAARTALKTRLPKLSTLELLPTEIKLQILYNIPTIRALRQLTRCSPTYHDLYISERERIFTRVTVNELLAKGIDILTPSILLEVRLKKGLKVDDFPHDSIRATFEDLHTSLSITPNKPLTLSIEQCHTLRKLHDVVAWNISIASTPQDNKVTASYQKLPSQESEYWTQPQCYYNVFLSKAAPEIRPRSGYRAMAQEHCRQGKLWGDREWARRAARTNRRNRSMIMEPISMVRGRMRRVLDNGLWFLP